MHHPSLGVHAVAYRNAAARGVSLTISTSSDGSSGGTSTPKASAMPSRNRQVEQRLENMHKLINHFSGSRSNLGPVGLGLGPQGL